MAMKSVSEHEKFADAFKAFYDGIQKLVEEGTTYQVVETLCWIECKEKGGAGNPLYLQDVINLGHQLGFLVNGEIVDPLPEVSDEFINACATLVNLPRLIALVRQVGAVLE